MSKINVLIVSQGEDETVYVDAGFVVPDDMSPEKFADRIHELLMDHFEEEDLEEETDDEQD